MRAVLGIDAAWTLTHPSGVAAALKNADGWRVVAAASSYQRFHALAGQQTSAERHPSGSSPDAPALLSSASVLCGREVDLVAIDMPLAFSPIKGRRESDRAVSKAYGGRKCGTYTPTVLRPGRVSDDLRESFERSGYPLRTEIATSPGLIEVYPHPALVELTGAAERLGCKASKVRAYWPSAAPQERRISLYQIWGQIERLLEKEMEGVPAALPKLELNANGRSVKA